MKTLTEFLREEAPQSFDHWLSLTKGRLHVNGLSLSAKAMLVATRFLREEKSTLVLTKDFRSAELWMERLSAFLPEESCLLFPGVALKPYEDKAPFEGLLEERLRFLVGSRARVVVCPLDSLLIRLISPSALSKKILHLRIGDVLDLPALRKRLLEMGFRDQPLVSGVGEFSLRGCILDINGFLHEHPVRLEFFGDEIESIRTFDIFSQRSIEHLEEISLYPLGECKPPLDFKLEKESEGYTWWNRAKFEALTASVFDYLPNARVVFDEFSLLSEKAKVIEKEFETRFAEISQWGIEADSPEKLWHTFESFSSHFEREPSLDLTVIENEAKNWIRIVSREQEFESSGVSSAEKKILEFSSRGARVFLSAPSASALFRIESLLPEVSFEELLVGQLPEGFWIEEDSFALLSDARIFNRHIQKKRKRTLSNSVSSALLAETLSRGDLVTHEDHGVGRYLGLTRVEVGGALVDCALLEYEGGDRLRFPVSDLKKIEKLATPEEGEIKLNRLGSKTWENKKRRVRERVIKIAQELVQLYAMRQNVEGFSFPPDSKWQKDFEAAFEFEPTPDQMTATADIKRDMESGRPMDRLVCGDVGFGKTEVAMRAAFKCVLSKKQVALLSPTTILAAQHYENFLSRFAGFPVNIALINRYKTTKEKNEIFERASLGKVDILIGTHALLSEKCKFKDLGLLIIDEEQKFGVKQKEKLREMRLSVDTLSMSATPIPRSLHLSLTGIRDISLINTAPMNRLPIETKLIKRDDNVLKRAVQKELSRGGQIFVVNDRVQTIEKLAEEVEEWVPEAKVGVAHGQMNDRDLERSMEAFISGMFDILVCTSIVESGIDVPRANTIIVMNAHHFGISQLYQMRGRVGRSDVLAYAYLVIPARGEISGDSARRLDALAQFTDLGSGYQLAMRDLEIRGAGNLLGSEQHGFMAEVGFETYMRMVREAVDKLKGKTSERPIPVRVELGVDAYLPETWVEDALTRISLYQRIARVSSRTEIENLRSELRDRFGEIPEASEMLLLVTEVGLIASHLKMQGILLRGGMLAVTFAEILPPGPEMLAELFSLCPFPMRYISGSPMQAVIEVGRGSLKEQVARVLETFGAFSTYQSPLSGTPLPS